MRLNPSAKLGCPSIITVTMKDKYGADDLPQVWDELRRKVGDVQGQLPPGTYPSIVNDDFGDVYGILLAVSRRWLHL